MLLNFEVIALALCFADIYFELYKLNALTLLDKLIGEPEDLTRGKYNSNA